MHRMPEIKVFACYSVVVVLNFGLRHELKALSLDNRITHGVGLAVD